MYLLSSSYVQGVAYKKKKMNKASFMSEPRNSRKLNIKEKKCTATSAK